jgi:hypothetical protein
MNKFYFNTGVNPSNVINFPYDYHKEKGDVIRGTLLIPFECDAPADATFMFACDNPNLPEAQNNNIIVREMFNTNMQSKYAYFELKS